MNIIRKIARPCGLVGGTWGLLAPLLIFVPLTCSRGTTPPITGGQTGKEIEAECISYYEMGMAGEVLPILSLIALIGLLGLLAVVLHKRDPHLGKIFMWVSASAMLVFSLFCIFSLGLFFLPAAILLIIAAAGMREVQEVPAREG